MCQYPRHFIRSVSSMCELALIWQPKKRTKIICMENYPKLSNWTLIVATRQSLVPCGGSYQTDPYPDCQTNLQKSAGFIRINSVRFFPKYAIFIRIIVNLGPKFENFIRIIEIPLREISGVLRSLNPEIRHVIYTENFAQKFGVAKKRGNNM